jgi:hypothetical protein
MGYNGSPDLRGFVCGLAKVAIFTTNVDAENKCLINHKCVCGVRNRHFCQTAVSGWASLFSVVSNIFCPVELVDKQHFRNYNKHNSRLVLVLELVCIFHIRKNIGKRLSALFLLSCVRSLGK